jgi:hypothetical protein
MEYTLDQLIEALQGQKAQGVPGDTPVVMPCRSASWVTKLTGINSSAAIAKKSAGKKVCEIVASRGIKVILLS